MEEEKRKAYSEVVEILKMIDDEKRIEKIPFEVIELIKGNSDPTYRPTLSREIPLEEQHLRNETYSIMAWIASKYWGEDIGEIPEIKEIKENKEEIEKVEEPEKIKEQIEEERPVRNAAVYNDIERDILDGTNLPALIPEMSLFERIKQKIIKIFKIIFRRNNSEEGVKE